MLVQSLDPLPRAIAAGSPFEESSECLTLSDPFISNECTNTVWAYAAETATVYAYPHADARRVSRLHRHTEDGFPEVYLLLRLHRDEAGQVWVKLRVPMRPNGSVGWVRRQAVGSFHATRDLLVVERAQLRMDFFTDGRLAWSAPVGLGGQYTPTRSGRSWIRERFKIFDPRSGFGPYAFGTANYAALTDWPGGSVIGIHGSHLDEDSLPMRPSRGCIVVRVADAAWLGEHLGLGTPLRVM